MVDALGARIKTARLAAGLKQSELAERIGKDQASVSAYELDHVEPPVKALIAIAEATGTTVGALLGEPPGDELYRALAEKLAALDNETRGIVLGYLLQPETAQED